MLEKEIYRREHWLTKPREVQRKQAEDHTSLLEAQWRPADFGSVHFFTMTFGHSDILLNIFVPLDYNLMPRL